MVQVGDAGHVVRHNAETFSGDFSTLQAALDDAKNSRRPLVIAPNSYAVTAPLLMNNFSDVHVFANGATFSAGADITSMLDMRDCQRCSWHGGWFKVPNGRVVDNAIYIYRDTVSAQRNLIDNVMIEGAYTVGLRIGKQGNGGQCDHMRLMNIECNGRGNAGQIGVYIGDGVYGNCLNHTVINLMSSNHETHVKVDATNAYFTGVFLDTAVTDLDVNSMAFSILDCRSEGATRFLKTAGPSTALANITVADALYNGETIAADGQWIQALSSGGLILDNVKAINAAHAPVIYANALLSIEARNLSTIATKAAAVSLNGGAVISGSYIQHDINGAVVGLSRYP